jgi:hypothetical protein
MDAQRPSADRPKLTWSDFQVFTAEDTDFAVKVQVSDGPRPQYSLEVGRMYKEKFVRFLRPSLSTEYGQVRLHPFDIQALGRLFGRAEAAIYEKAQEREDIWTAQRQARDERATTDGNRSSRHTGKTQRERDKRNKQKNNGNNNRYEGAR